MREGASTVCEGVAHEMTLRSIRRLLYVATTRAQGLLYITHSSERMMAGETKKCKLSEFVMIPLRNNLVCPLCYLPSERD